MGSALAVYAAPDGSYTATPARLARRALAAALDWTLAYVLYLLVSIPAGALQAVGRLSRLEGDLGGVPGLVLDVLAQALALAPVVLYFVAYWRTGSTLGMRAVGIELVAEPSGKEPGTARSLVRALLAFVFGASTYILFLAATGEPPAGGYGKLERLAIDAASVFVVMAALGKALALLDPLRRTLWDNLVGFVYVEDIVSAEARDAAWVSWLARRG